jgi:fused signal recognition particle receptor
LFPFKKENKFKEINSSKIMFKFLKEKISGWTKKIKEEVETVEESPKEEKKEKKKTQKEIETVEESPKEEKKLKEEVETVEESPKEKKKKGFLKKMFSGNIEIKEEDFDKYKEDLELILLENNVAFIVAEKIIEELKEKIVGKEIEKKNLEKEINQALKEIIEEVLVEPYDLIEKVKNKEKDPYVILFCGINGSGKTTTIAKLANKLKEKGISCVLAAGDTFRAASIEQLKAHGERIGVKVIAGDYGVDPSSVGFDAIKYAKKNKIKCVLIDTAGRIHTATNLLREMEKIVRVTSPDSKIFIGESITGNDATEQIKSFNDAIGIEGIILSKADIDEKGGTALSVGYTSKKPILFLGMGQEYSDLIKFDKKLFIEKLGLE